MMNVTKRTNKSMLRACALLLIIYLLCPVAADAQRAPRRAPTSPLAWPPITKQNKPWTRWWWLGSIVNKQDLTTEMRKYEQAGLGGLELTPIYGVKGYEDRFINFLSPAWVEMLEHTLREADRLGMGVDMSTGTGWPFGGPWVGADDACKNLVAKTYAVKGGARLDETIRYVQKPLVRTVGTRVKITDLKDPVSANENLQALALDQVRFEKPLPLQALMAYSENGAALNLTDKVDSNGKLNWVAPAGNWKLYALFQGWHGKLVERAAPGGEGNVIDHFSDQALKHYLSKFDQAFAGHNIKSLRAFFNDSYEVDDGDGQSDWTPAFFAEFQTRRGYDLRAHLPALLGDDASEQNARVRYDFRETISDLLLDRFTLTWRQWAASKGAIIRNQGHGSPANILDLYAASDIPETEGTDIIRMKFASSAANVTGKPLASAETVTWLNEHFQSSLGDVKRAVDLNFLGGINHVLYHGLAFSPQQEAWPGWLFYAAVHFGPVNSFWDDFPALNRYIAHTQSFLQSGRPDNDVLLYYPIHDMWSERGDEGRLIHVGGGHDVGITQGDAQALFDAGYAFDLISDRQLAGVTFAGRALQTGGQTYSVIVLPESRFIPLKTFTQLVALAQRGATVVVRKSLPSDVPGLANLDARRSEFRQLLAQLRFVNVNGTEMQSAQIGAGRFLRGDDLKQLLAHAGIKREAMADQDLRFTRRKYQGGTYYFILNRGAQAIDGWVPLQARARAVALFDPLRETSGLARLRATANGAQEVYLQLAPGASCILKTFDADVRAPAYDYFKPSGDAEPLRATWSVRFVKGGPELPPTVERTELGSWTDYGGDVVKKFSGTALYTTTFNRTPAMTGDLLLDLGRVAESARVRLNGQDLGTLIVSPYRIKLPARSCASRTRLRSLCRT